MIKPCDKELFNSDLSPMRGKPFDKILHIKDLSNKKIASEFEIKSAGNCNFNSRGVKNNELSYQCFIFECIITYVIGGKNYVKLSRKIMISSNKTPKRMKKKEEKKYSLF